MLLRGRRAPAFHEAVPEHVPFQRCDGIVRTDTAQVEAVLHQLCGRSRYG